MNASLSTKAADGDCSVAVAGVEALPLAAGSKNFKEVRAFHAVVLFNRRLLL